jgi:cation:H+ antiporter
MELVLLVSSFAILLAGALLFTNGIEWLGHRLQIAQGAVGSLLAAAATALPESLIPVIALVEGAPGADDVAIGAVVGAPFLLATIAMALVGVSAFAYRARRPRGPVLDAHQPTLARDLSLFLACFTVALALGVGDAPRALRVAVAIVLAGVYVVYVRLTLTGGGAAQEEETLKPLVLDPSRGDPPSTVNVVLQLAVALGAIVGGAHLFVEEVLHFAESLDVAPVVLALVLAPLATELPEKANSFFWVREGKDTLALGNITGALVFQSTLPVAVVLAFTDWDLGGFAVLAAALALAGGVVAVAALRLQARFGPAAIAAWVVLYGVFVAAVAGG